MAWLACHFHNECPDQVKAMVTLTLSQKKKNFTFCCHTVDFEKLYSTNKKRKILTMIFYFVS